MFVLFVFRLLAVCMMTWSVLIRLTMFFWCVTTVVLELWVMTVLTLALMNGVLVCSSGIVRCRTPDFTRVWPVLLPLRNGTSVVVIDISRPGDMLTRLMVLIGPSTKLLVRWAETSLLMKPFLVLSAVPVRVMARCTLLAVDTQTILLAIPFLIMW